MIQHLRIARPVSDIARSSTMYCNGLGLQILSRFEDHDGFDGVMLGTPDAHYHFEFTRCRARVVTPTPTREDLVILYIPDQDDWTQACRRMIDAGFTRVMSANSYWEVRGAVFEDADGYRTVLERAAWSVHDSARQTVAAVRDR
jgi:catechol 2,3-dioxygenase-like lactoylglutathione lyase family enzyme